jgi:hypothetical protein
MPVPVLVELDPAVDVEVEASPPALDDAPPLEAVVAAGDPPPEPVAPVLVLPVSSNA